MKRQQIQLLRSPQGAQQAARYGYSLRRSDSEAEHENASTLRLGRTLLRLLAALPLTILVLVAFLAALVIERLGEPAQRN